MERGENEIIRIIKSEGVRANGKQGANENE